MRRFLGASGWVRKSFPKEVIVVLPTLTAQLKKDAVWPMPDQAVKAKLALQALAIRAILLTVVDEIAAEAVRADRGRLQIRVGGHRVPALPLQAVPRGQGDVQRPFDGA